MLVIKNLLFEPINFFFIKLYEWTYFSVIPEMPNGICLTLYFYCEIPFTSCYDNNFHVWKYILGWNFTVPVSFDNYMTFVFCSFCFAVTNSKGTSGFSCWFYNRWKSGSYSKLYEWFAVTFITCKKFISIFVKFTLIYNRQYIVHCVCTTFEIYNENSLLW